MKALLLVLVILAFFYAFYTGAMAVWSYFQMWDAVDTAVQEHGKAGATAVRGSLLHSASEAGVPIQERQVAIEEDSAAFNVRLQWAWPVITYKGETVLAIPISLERSLKRP